MKKLIDRGQEILHFYNSVYQGEKLNELPHGKGIALWNTGNIYFGKLLYKTRNTNNKKKSLKIFLFIGNWKKWVLRW